MKFFVYTLAKLPSGGEAHAYHASSEYVSAQPLREILSMMVLKQGKLCLCLPASTPSTTFVVERYLVTELLPYAQMLTAKTAQDFNEQVPDVMTPESVAEVTKHVKMVRDRDESLANLFGSLGG